MEDLFCSWDILVCMEMWEGADNVYGIGSVTVESLNRNKIPWSLNRDKIIPWTGSSGSSNYLLCKGSKTFCWKKEKVKLQACFNLRPWVLPCYCWCYRECVCICPHEKQLKAAEEFWSAKIVVATCSNRLCAVERINWLKWLTHFCVFHNTWTFCKVKGKCSLWFVYTK